MLYDDYIKESLNETINIYGPDTVGRMEDFKTFFEDATLLSAIKGHQLAFTSAGNIPTSNISQALIGSGINKSGQLPIGRCYLTNILDDENLQKIIDEINKIFKEHDDLILEGTNKAFDLPEFQKAELAKNFMNVLDAKDLVSEVLNTGVAEDINVYIGEELQDEKLKDFSVVTFNHLLGDKDIGTIGIIGPTRMDYSKVISIMKYISKKLKEDHDE